MRNTIRGEQGERSERLSESAIVTKSQSRQGHSSMFVP